MEYKEFVGICKQRISEILGEDFNVKETTITKNNDKVLTGLSIGEKSANVFPIIYLEEFFISYNEGSDLDSILNEILRVYSDNRLCDFDTESFNAWEYIKDRICFKLISRERNRELLKNVPHRPFLDLAVVYCVIVNSGENPASIMIKNSHLDLWGKSERSLNKCAKSNTPRILPETVMNMSDIIPGDTKFPMYVISNPNKVNGATVLMYSKAIKTISETLGEDLVILPSSVHEVIVVPKSVGDSDELRSLVHSVNTDVLGDMDFLSDSIYEYSLDTDSLKVA